MMKVCIALALVSVASAIAPPRISLDLSGSSKTSRDFASTCPAGLTGTDQKLCPFPKASAWDHNDQRVKVTTVIKCVDGCATRNMVVTKPNMALRSSYIFTYDAVDDAGNNAEQITFALVLNDKIAPKISMCGNRAEKVQAASTWKLCSGSFANDNIDGAITRKIRYTVKKVDGKSPEVLCKNCRYSEAAATLPTTAVGEFLVTLNVHDNAGFYGKDGNNNKATAVSKAILIRDTIAPKCTITGGTAVVECGAGYTDNGAVCTDSLDGKIKTSVISTVDTKTTGRYTVTYTGTDKAGNSAGIKAREVVVRDTKAPEITLKGDRFVVHKVSDGEKYTDAGIAMKDRCPGKLTLRKSWNPPFSAHTVGTYTRTYEVRDAAGHVSRAVRIVKVVDDVKPIITVTGRDTLTLEATNSKVYDDKGATCADTSHSKTIKVEVTGDEVKLQTPGTYTVTYNCEDMSGNAAVTRTRVIIVRDTIAPKITIVGEDEQIEAGFKYTDKGAKAYDNLNRMIDSRISKKIFFNKKQVKWVDTRKTGTYSIVYSADDKSGNKAVKMTRLVKVIDTLAPVITIQLKSTVHTKANDDKGINGVTNPANDSPFSRSIKSLDESSL